MRGTTEFTKFTRDIEIKLKDSLTKIKNNLNKVWVRLWVLLWVRHRYQLGNSATHSFVKNESIHLRWISTPLSTKILGLFSTFFGTILKYVSFLVYFCVNPIGVCQYASGTFKVVFACIYTSLCKSRRCWPFQVLKSVHILVWLWVVLLRFFEWICMVPTLGQCQKMRSF